MIERLIDRMVLGTIGFFYGVAVNVLRRLKRTR